MCEITGCETLSNLPAIVVSASTRRQFVKGLLSLPLATVLAIPELTRAAADRVENISLTTGSGKSVSAAVAWPDAKDAPAVLLIHEWWGLNDQIKSVASEFANLGYVALAVDLYDEKVATVADDARAYMQAVDANEAMDTLAGWIAWLRSHPDTNGKVGTVGWCFGGGWSLNASIASPVDATVIYYGNVKKTAGELATLHGPVLAHFATRDDWINQQMVDGFVMAMSDADKGDALNVHWYEADHAFANPTSARYDADDAALAWQRTTQFFRENLG